MAVELGETVVMIRRGRPVVRLVPEPAIPERVAAIARIRTLRERVGGRPSLGDVLSPGTRGVGDAGGRRLADRRLLLPDEKGGDPKLLESRELVAPGLLWAELRNRLVNERRGRLAPGLAEQMLDAVDALGIHLDTRPSDARVLQLARRHRLTVHDALYLELVPRLDAGLAMLDTGLRDAARSASVTLAG